VPAAALPGAGRRSTVTRGLDPRTPTGTLRPMGRLTDRGVLIVGGGSAGGGGRLEGRP